MRCWRVYYSDYMIEFMINMGIGFVKDLIGLVVVPGK